MAKYRIHVDGGDVALNKIPDGRTKTAIVQLISAFDKHLASVQCDIHHGEPLVFIYFKSGACTGYGFGPCCETLSKKLSQLAENITLPGIVPGAPITVRVLKHIEVG